MPGKKEEFSVNEAEYQGRIRDLTTDRDNAVKRIETLEQIILRLRACYKWDREEYQSNLDLVADVEKAMSGVRMRERK